MLPTVEDQLLLAKAYYTKGMTLESINTYQKALANVEVDELLKSKFQYAKILQTQRKYKKTDSLNSNLLNVMPENAEFLYHKGKIGNNLKKWHFINTILKLWSKMLHI